MLIKCQIFARMSPEQKQVVVERMQLLGYCVGFCGDGTNDCGALKAADVGISLSEAEASVAAPFTSAKTDLECVLRVIQEGRAALVTSFSCFKYMALYSMIQFSSVSILYTLAQNIGDWQFMYIDLVLIIPIAVFMGRTGPFPNIDRKRPTASLVSKKVLSSIFSQILLSLGFQVLVFVWVRRMPWYKSSVTDIERNDYLSFENTVIFLMSSFQYVFVAMVFNVGPPYQVSVWENSILLFTIVPLVTTFGLLLSFTTMMTLCPPHKLTKLFHIVEIPIDGRLVIFSLAILNLLISWLAERHLVPRLIRSLFSVSDKIVSSRLQDTMHAKILKWEKAGKRFKIIQNEFHSH